MIYRVQSSWNNRGNGRHSKAMYRPSVLTIGVIRNAYEKAWNAGSSDTDGQSDWFVVVPDNREKAITNAINGNPSLTLVAGYPRAE